MTFEFDGEKYRQASNHQKEWGRRMIDGLELKGDEHVLDLGCGDGVLTGRIAELVPRGFVLGIDASRGMLDTARQLETGNLKFELLDINAIAFDEQFDLVFSNATLQWVKDHATLLANVHRSLKPGGVVRFNFAAEGNCATFFLVVRAVMQFPEYETYFRDFAWPWYMPGLAQYRELIDRGPFREFQLKGENADRYFPDRETMIAWLDQPSLVPFLKLLEPEARKPFRDAVVERMVAATLQADGTCFETFRRIDVCARKS